MSQQTTHRKWQMIKVASGDYLLPGNDGVSLWRLWRYDEDDGTLTTDDGKVITGTFWAASRWKEPVGYGADVSDPDGWIEQANLLPTRKAAIDYVLCRSGG